jgi:hypothetical protein
MAAGSPDQPAPEHALEERYGIVALTRMHKDDGRSLILYRLAADGVDAGVAAEPPSVSDRGQT